MQIIGPRYADARILAASATFERLRPWAETYRIPASRAV
jgi:amidase/aspartyl-tRNA(Asn)/glutamyl-tRNA(Gln) amidotransferase subunit A